MVIGVGGAVGLLILVGIVGVLARGCYIYAKRGYISLFPKPAKPPSPEGERYHERTEQERRERGVYTRTIEYY